MYMYPHTYIYCICIKHPISFVKNT
jgi:hypothetical protein